MSSSEGPSMRVDTASLPAPPSASAQSPGIEAEEQSSRLPSSPTSLLASLAISDPTQLDASTRLVTALNAARKKPKPLIRATGHSVGAHQLLSWKTSEFAYRKSNSVGTELPTLARGIFTERVAGTEERHKVSVRGYDKFFNLGEMPWTKPASISAYTTAPYVLTFKENGCIIFIAALEPDQVVVTSKHSLGPIQGTPVTHAQKGEEWLDIHLARAGKTRKQLAAELWRRNETAVFELCDDEFEEHVLEYSKEKSGLHLHGLNKNAADFETRPMPEVDAFAREWGFLPTRWIEIGSLKDVEEFTDRIGTSGSWNGEPIEGFVIRTHMPNVPVASEAVSPPYAPGQAWFYKVKFDEPYLMYRDWRELTRKMLSQKAAWDKQVNGAVGKSAENKDTQHEAKATAASATAETPQQPQAGDSKPSKNALKKERKKLERQNKESEAKERAAAVRAGMAPPDPPQARSKRPETLLFIQWCYDRIYGTNGVKAQPHLFATFNEGKGIIALRNHFLAYLETEEGQRKLGAAAGRKSANAVAVAEDTRPFTKTVITPIAIPGCGKTVLAVALRELFGFAHVQSDDVKNKKGFLHNVEKAIGQHDVVFADKNNHLFQQRDELIELVQRLSDPAQAVRPKKGHAAATAAVVPRIRTVALAWQLDRVPLNTLHRICADRIMERGERHQSLRADTAGAAGSRDHETILWRFLEQLQPFGSAGSGEGSSGFGDAKFDRTVWLAVSQSPEEALRQVVRELCPVLDLTMPSDAAVRSALQTALAYDPDVKRKADTGSGAGAAGPRYYGVAVEMDLRTLLDPLLGDRDSDAVALYSQLRAAKRITPRPHITLVHSTEREHGGDGAERWARYAALSASGGAVEFRITLDRVVWDDGRCMALGVADVQCDALPDLACLQGASWTPHITVGTAAPDIRPVEAGRAVREAAAASGAGAGAGAGWRAGLHVLRLAERVHVLGRLAGMSH